MIPKTLSSVLALLVLGLPACSHRAFRFQVTFPGAPGLKTGSEVRYLGLKVGEVEKVFIQQPQSSGTPEIVVIVAVKDRSVHIRRDDKFGVATQGLLGDGYLDITPGPSNSPILSEGATVRGELSTIRLKDGSTLVDSFDLAAKLNSLPKEKREELLKTFNRLLDEAAGQQRQNSSSPGDSRTH